mgnify:CR=1 FL=1
MKIIFVSLTIICQIHFISAQDIINNSWEHEKLWVAEKNESNLKIADESITMKLGRKGSKKKA